MSRQKQKRNEDFIEPCIETQSAALCTRNSQIRLLIAGEASEIKPSEPRDTWEFLCSVNPWYAECFVARVCTAMRKIPDILLESRFFVDRYGETKSQTLTTSHDWQQRYSPRSASPSGFLRKTGDENRRKVTTEWIHSTVKTVSSSV